MTTAADINTYLATSNSTDTTWHYRAATGYWVVDFHTVPLCTVNLTLGPELLSCEADLGLFRCLPGCRLALYYYLLRLNNELPAIKFGVKGTRVTILAEAPAAQLSLGAFTTLLRLVATTFEQYRLEIELLAGDQVLADAVLPAGSEPVRLRPS